MERWVCCVVGSKAFPSQDLRLLNVINFRKLVLFLEQFLPALIQSEISRLKFVRGILQLGTRRSIALRKIRVYGG